MLLVIYYKYYPGDLKSMKRKLTTEAGFKVYLVARSSAIARYIKAIR